MKIVESKFAEQLAARTNAPVSHVKEFLGSFKRAIYEATAKGDSVELSGFVKFTTSHRHPRLGVNPRSLERMTIPELITPKIVAGEAWKKAVAIK